MGFAWEILSPGVITKVMQETQDKLTLPMPLLWMNRAAKVNASDDEMTLKEKSYVYAADIISADARAVIRDAGEMSFERHSIAKLKHGFALSESMMKTIRRIEAGRFMDNDVVSFASYISRRQKELMLGLDQRVEAMVNGMFCDSYNYARLGLRMEGTFGMPADLKFNPVTTWKDRANSKPITDIINVLQYATRTYGEGYNRITLSYEAFSDIIGSTEFKDIYAAQAFNYAPSNPNATVNARASNPQFYMSFVANFVGASLAGSSAGDGRQVTIEIDDSQYREYSSASTVRGTVKFHPANKVYFSNSSDDNSSAGWDIGNGEVLESLLGGIGLGNIINGQNLGGVNYGPVGYTTLQDPNLNPPGLVMWAAAWIAPRKHRDTCSALLTAWDD
jgi:hypothetical protein